MVADSGVQTDTFDDRPCIQSLQLRISVQFVKVADTQGKVRIGKELHRLCLRKAHEHGVNIFLQGTFLQQVCKGVRGIHQTGIRQVGAYNDTAGIQIVIQRFALTQKFRTEQDVLAVHLFPDTFGIAHRNRGFNHHDGVGIHR